MTVSGDDPRQLPDVGYDLRRGADGYAPILGTFGALAIPAILVVFTIPDENKIPQDELVKVIGFLCLTVLAGVGSSFTFAAIAAERARTPNLPPAMMAASLPATITFVTLFSAIEVLVDHYLPDSGPAFVLLVAATGVMGVFLTAATLIGAVFFSKKSSRFRSERWPTNVRQANFHLRLMVAIGLVGISAGVAAREVNLFLVATKSAFSAYLVVVVIALLISVIYAVVRAQHDNDGRSKGMGPTEAYLLSLAPTTFTIVTLLINPS